MFVQVKSEKPTPFMGGRMSQSWGIKRNDEGTRMTHGGGKK